jgi:hypothetical protein
VQPVTSGERRVLVVELWEGLPRRCPRRCVTPWGPCVCTFREEPPLYLPGGAHTPKAAGFAPLKPSLKLMRKSAEELREMSDALADEQPAQAAAWQEVGAHAQWMMRKQLEREYAVAKEWTKE